MSYVPCRLQPTCLCCDRVAGVMRDQQRYCSGRILHGQGAVTIPVPRTARLHADWGVGLVHADAEDPVTSRCADIKILHPPMKPFGREKTADDYLNVDIWAPLYFNQCTVCMRPFLGMLTLQRSMCDAIFSIWGKQVGCQKKHESLFSHKDPLLRYTASKRAEESPILA